MNHTSAVRTNDACPPWVQDFAESVIAQTEQAWSAAGEYPPRKCGFYVFYSPVRLRPKLMLIGEQPGGGQDAFCLEQALSIPKEHDYVRHPEWLIARKMRSLFSGINRLKFLEQSVKLNLNFFRAPSSSAWRTTPAPLRRRLETFCEQEVHEIVKTLQPRLIVCEGLGVYDRMLRQRSVTRREVVLTRRDGSRLYCRAEVAPGIRLVGFPHPCGMAQPRKDEWPCIGEALASDLDWIDSAGPQLVNCQAA